jgi:uncharacterized membrane protein
MSMTAGKVFTLFALILLCIPLTEACFVSSLVELDIEDVSPLESSTSETIDANVAFEWGIGALFAAPVVIYIEVEKSPEWTYVETSEDSFTVQPGFFEGFLGGSESETIPIKITTITEAEAFVSSPLKIRAYTNGSVLIQESMAEEEIYISQTFHDKGLFSSLSSQNIDMVKGESEQIVLNLTNECNGDVTVAFLIENLTEDWKISFSHQQIVIPSSYSGNNEKTVSLKVKAEGEGSEEGTLKIQYFPTNNPEWGENEKSLTLFFKSTEKGSIGGLIGVILLIVFLLILIVVWKKRRG